MYKNVVVKGNAEEEKANKLAAFLKADDFDYFFEYFTEDNAPTEEAMSFQVVKNDVLEMIYNVNCQGREALKGSQVQ